MSTAASPLVAAIQSRLAQLQGGASPQAPGAPGSSAGAGPAPDDVGQMLSQQSAELHGADPTLILRQVKKIRDAIGMMFIQTFQSLPNVAGHLSKSLGTLDRAIKEAESAAQTASAVRPPIGLSLANNQPDGQGPSSGMVQ